jgi:hypothetical protein
MDGLSINECFLIQYASSTETWLTNKQRHKHANEPFSSHSPDAEWHARCMVYWLDKTMMYNLKAVGNFSILLVCLLLCAKSLGNVRNTKA